MSDQIGRLAAEAAVRRLPPLPQDGYDQRKRHFSHPAAGCHIVNSALAKCRNSQHYATTVELAATGGS